MVHDVVVRSSLVSLVVSSHSEHSLHPSLREVQGSHFLQGFIHIQPPDQVTGVGSSCPSVLILGQFSISTSNGSG